MRVMSAIQKYRTEAGAKPSDTSTALKRTWKFRTHKQSTATHTIQAEQENIRNYQNGLQSKKAWANKQNEDEL